MWAPQKTLWPPSIMSQAGYGPASTWKLSDRTSFTFCSYSSLSKKRYLLSEELFWFYPKITAFERGLRTFRLNL